MTTTIKTLKRLFGLEPRISRESHYLLLELKHLRRRQQEKLKQLLLPFTSENRIDEQPCPQ